jgi:PilZ domain
LQGAEHRAEDRTRALVRATLRGDGDEREACILDVSSRGLLLTAAAPPPRGAFVELVVGRHSLIGQVKWSSQRRFGLVLRERISVVGLLSGDGEAIKLAPRRQQGKQRRRIAEGTAPLARMIQFGMLIAAVGAGALMLSRVSTQGLAPLRLAGTALHAR